MTYPDTRRPSRILGEQVRTHRKIQRLSMEALALRCVKVGAPELTYDAIQKIEKGRRAGVTIEEWLALSAALGVFPNMLLLPEDNVNVTITRTRWLSARKLFRWLSGQVNPFGAYVSPSVWLPYLAGDHTVAHHDLMNVIPPAKTMPTDIHNLFGMDLYLALSEADRQLIRVRDVKLKGTIFPSGITLTDKQLESLIQIQSTNDLKEQNNAD
jgi:transcriptional regulator with XRE-family HTH domain